MPVHFRRDEIPVEAEPNVPPRDEDDEGGFNAGLMIAARSCLIWLIVAAPLLFIGLKAMKRALLAADKLWHHGQGDHWQEMWMPAMLFVFFGAIFGVTIAWRMSARASLGTTSICLAAAEAALLLGAAGSLAAFSIFEKGVPLMCWVCLTAMTLSTIAGAFGFTRWTE